MNLMKKKKEILPIMNEILKLVNTTKTHYIVDVDKYRC